MHFERRGLRCDTPFKTSLREVISSPPLLPQGYAGSAEGRYALAGEVDQAVIDELMASEQFLSFGPDTLAVLAFTLPFMACAYFLLLGLLAELVVKASGVHGSGRSKGRAA